MKKLLTYHYTGGLDWCQNWVEIKLAEANFPRWMIAPYSCLREQGVRQLQPTKIQPISDVNFQMTQQWKNRTQSIKGKGLKAFPRHCKFRKFGYIPVFRNCLVFFRISCSSSFLKKSFYLKKIEKICIINEAKVFLGVKNICWANSSN